MFSQFSFSIQKHILEKKTSWVIFMSQFFHSLCQSTAINESKQVAQILD